MILNFSDSEFLTQSCPRMQSVQQCVALVVYVQCEMIAYGTSSVFFQFGPLRLMEAFWILLCTFTISALELIGGKWPIITSKCPLLSWCPGQGTEHTLSCQSLKEQTYLQEEKKRAHNSLTNIPFNIYSSLSWVKAVEYKLGSCQVLTTSNSHFSESSVFGEEILRSSTWKEISHVYVVE